MRRIQILCMLAPIALVAAASLGASSAAATAFCERNENPCPVEYTNGKPFQLDLTQKEAPVLLASTGKEVKCSEAAAKANFSEESGESLVGTVSEMTFAGCSTGCTQSAQNLPYKVEAKATGSGNGTLRLSSGGSGNPQLKVNCSGAECAYGGSEILLEAAGGEPQVVTASKASLSREFGTLAACGKSATFTAKYSPTDYEALFLVAAGNSSFLCKEAPAVKEKGEEKYLECPAEKGYSGVVKGTLTEGRVVTIEALAGPPNGTITCAESLLEGNFNSNGTSVPKAGVTTWTLNTKGGSCTSTLLAPKNPNVAVTVQNLPLSKSRFTYIQWVGAQGALTLQGPKGLAPKVVLTFEASLCEYEQEFAVSSFENAAGKAPSLAKEVIQLKWTNKLGPNCPTALSLKATLTMTQAAGGALYLAEE